MSTASASTVDTRVGPFSAVVAADGAVLASGWTADTAELVALIPTAIRPSGLRERRDLGRVTTAIRDYHAGKLDAVDTIPVRQRGGPFMAHAWTVLRKVPAGEPVSYAEYAQLTGRPTAVRAAAAACARNPAALFVPCHRVVRTGGGMGGFRWGVDIKRWLLDHESQL